MTPYPPCLLPLKLGIALLLKLEMHESLPEGSGFKRGLLLYGKEM